MKKNIAPVLIVLVLIVVIGAVGTVTFLIDRKTPSKTHMDLSTYYNVTDDTQVALVADDTVCEKLGKLIDGSVFVDYDTVSTNINKRIYWDPEENVLVVTTPTQVIKNDLSVDNPGVYRLIDGQLYLSMDFIQQYTDMEMQMLEAPARMVMKTEWNGYSCVDVTADSAVRYKGGIKSDILTEVTAGTVLRLVDTLDNWYQVATADGYVGYIEKTSAGEPYEQTQEHTSSIGDYTSLTKDYKINMVWHQTTSQAANAALAASIANTKGLNTIAPTWFFINDTDGNLTSLASTDYVNAAHNAGMEVWAVINDFDGAMNSSDGTYTVLNSTAKREKIIAQLMEAAAATGFDGINVDIEKVPEKGGPDFIQFIRELSVSCRNAGLVLSVDDYVPMPYTAYLDRKEQGIVADYVITMGYDEHTSSSEEAGSVASIGFVKDGITNILKEVPANKAIMGIPFYTRFWTTNSNGVIESATYNMTDAAALVDQYHLQTYFDETSGQNYGEASDELNEYQIWFEDADSIGLKMQAIQEGNLAGVAAWKLGFESADIWDVISQHLQ
ncbi:MAG: glycosyl hydrolase family 18 protein [Lachnospiraceae bacterium]|nr:glycosyl hydrolase family 18 protein [Lachnospiraceae bacterium]